LCSDDEHSYRVDRLAGGGESSLTQREEEVRR
jgi:hypothetical protein